MSATLTDWLLQHYGKEEVTRETGLGRIRSALEPLIGELSLKTIVTVAGTNGKGETILWLSRKLHHRSHCVWISPHVERITERFRDEKGEIALSELQRLVEHCHEKVQENNYQLSFYEFLFFVFCHWVKEKNPEILLLEVGMGGRLDAVNVFNADLLLLPSISRDHQEFLGNRYDLILEEKLALLRPGKTLVSFLSLSYLRERARDIAEGVGARMIDLEQLNLASHWDFSSRNQFLAHAAFLLLERNQDVGKELLKLPIEKNFLEHRGEVLRERGEWIFYGSHNVDGLRNLIQFLQSGTYNFSRPPFDAVLVSFSRRNFRDLLVMARMLRGAGLGNIFLTTFPHPKAVTRETMESFSGQEGMNFVQDVSDYVQKAPQGHRTLVTGSYYFLAHIKGLIRRG